MAMPSIDRAASSFRRQPDLRDEAYVLALKQRWGAHPPKWMQVIEFFGTGDPGFGGSADDRPLGTHGRIVEGPRWLTGERAARFETIDQAHAAALRIPNLRPGGLLGVLTWWTESPD